MNLLKATMAVLSVFSTLACTGQCPVKTKTVRITYSKYTNSGIAINTSYTLLEESLTWDYSEHRNGLVLHDVCKLDQQDFRQLIEALSVIKFHSETNKAPTSGGEGWSCTFYDKKKCYLSMDDESNLTGDYEEVLRLLQDFISKHKPAGEKLFDELCTQPHERGIYSEFEALPEALRKYKLN